MKVGGHHGKGSHLRRAGDSERLAQEMRQEIDAPRNRGRQQDDRGGARERELEADVPGEIWMPCQHRRRGQAE